MLCGEKGCRVCKHTGWLEFMGAGMVHPNVLKAGGIDSKNIKDGRFGFGLTRLVMMRYGIDDIRLLTGGDLTLSRTILTCACALFTNENISKLD